MKPQLVSCYFSQAHGSDQWPRLADVLRLTAARHCPGWDSRIEEIEPSTLDVAGRSPSEIANTQKLDHWSAAVQAAPDGAQLLLMDTDTMVLRALDDVWELAFDFAYTVKPSAAVWPLNAGVVFVRVSPATREWMATWAEHNRRMLHDRAYHRLWYRTYGGLNQSALGALLCSGLAKKLGLELARLPCVEWNCEESSWAAYSPEVTRIVHVKSVLRRVVFGINGAGTTRRVRPLATIWRKLEAEVRP